MTDQPRRERSRRRRALAAGAVAFLLGLEVQAAPEGRRGEPAESRTTAPARNADFGEFVQRLWPEASAAGISRETFDAAFRGVTPDPKVVALTKKQSEFTRPIWDYVEGSASAGRVAKGQAAAAQWGATLAAVESAYGVPREIVLAVWGMESGFGANTGSLDVVRSLASLAFVRYRGDFFRGELLGALRILQEGGVSRQGLRGSWAGAMGQTQFMPSSYLAYAVDGDGDGRRDIWTSVPDALASTANFLRQKGWTPGLPWVVEVAVPGKTDLSAARRPFADWAALGLQRTDGQALPRSGDATLLMPAGIRGPAFLLGDNFEVIRAYNSSDAYALGVGHLANRIAGGPAIARPWPTGEKVLSKGEREEVQKRLSGLGLYSGDHDGRHGAKTRDAIRAFQIRSGLVSDGYADFAVLKALRGGK